MPGKPAEPARLGEADEHAAVAVRRQGEPTGRVEQQGTGRGIDRRQVLLTKHMHAVGQEAAVTLVVEKLPRLSVGRGTGHDRQRHLAAEPPADRPQPAEKVLKQVGLRHGADRVESLRTGAAEPRTLASGDEDRPDPARPQGLLAGSHRRRWRNRIGGVSKPHHRWCGGMGEVVGGCGGMIGTRRGEPLQFGELTPVDDRKLAQQLAAVRSVEAVPEPQQVRLPRLTQGLGKLAGNAIDAVGHRHPRTHAQSRKQSRGSRRRSRRR